MSGGLSRGTPASLLAAASSPQFPWLAYFVLQSEDLWWREAGGGLWRRLVEQLAKEKPLEESLLAAARTAEVTAPPSTYLPLYRWAQHYITISQYNYITISQYYNISILQYLNITMLQYYKVGPASAGHSARPPAGDGLLAEVLPAVAGQASAAAW